MRCRSCSKKKQWEREGCREKWTAALTEAHRTPQARVRMSASAIEVGRRPEVKAGRSKAVRESQARPETKIQRCKLSKELWENATYRLKVSVGVSKAMLQPEARAKRSEREKLRWSNPEYKDRRVRELRVAEHVRPNKPEQVVLSLLNELYPKQWIYTGDGSRVIGGLNPDFLDDNKKQIIEMFGDYWHHGIGVKDWKRTEIGRMMAFNSFGYRTLIIWEHELDDVPSLTKRIRSFRRSNGVHVSV